MILVDSHVLLWLLTNRRTLGRRAMRSIEAAASVHVSAATVWELTIKAMLGRLTIPDDLEARLEAQGFTLLDVTVAHAAGIRLFPEIARHDPFDRLLVSQASIEGMRLLTADQTLLQLDRGFIVDADM